MELMAATALKALGTTVSGAGIAWAPAGMTVAQATAAGVMPSLTAAKVAAGVGTAIKTAGTILQTAGPAVDAFNTYRGANFEAKQMQQQAGRKGPPRNAAPVRNAGRASFSSPARRRWLRPPAGGGRSHRGGCHRGSGRGRGIPRPERDVGRRGARDRSFVRCEGTQAPRASRSGIRACRHQGHDP